MKVRGASSWWMACLAIAVTTTGGLTIGCSLWSCPEEAPILIDDGTYHERPMTDPPPRPPLSEVSATLEDGELTIQYIQDTDGRTYVVRLRELD
jgi:hypothetical protein